MTATPIAPFDKPQTIRPAREGTVRWKIEQLRTNSDDFLRTGKTVTEIAQRLGSIHSTTRNACEMLAWSGGLIAYYATGQLGRPAIHYRRPAADDQ